MKIAQVGRYRIIILGRLENLGHSPKPLILHEPTEVSRSERPPTYVLVAIPLRSQLSLGIIHVEEPKPIQTQHIVERLENTAVVLDHVVSG